MTREEVEQAVIWDSVLLSTEYPDKEFKVAYLHGDEPDHVCLYYTVDDDRYTYSVPLSSISIKPRASTFCQISCSPSDHKVGGKCYYMGCVKDDDKLADDEKV